MRLIRSLAALAACVLFGSLAAAPLSARPLDEVKTSGELLIAVYDDFAPYSFEKDGQPHGVDVEIGRALAEKLGVKPKFVLRMAGENVSDDLRVNLWQGPRTGGGVVDVMLHVPAAKELGLKDEFVFPIGRYYSERVALLVDPAKVGANETLALFISHPIGVELDTLADMYVSSPQTAEGKIGQNAFRYRNFDAAIEGLKKGEVAGLLGPQAQLEWAAREVGRPVKVGRPPMPGLEVTGWDVGIAVKADSRDLGYKLVDTLTEMRKSGALTEIFKQYGLTYEAEFDDQN